MKRTVAIACAALTSAVVAAPGASAAVHDCGATVADIGSVGYVALDDAQLPVLSLWIYLETNGDPGLQRDDDSCAGSRSDFIALGL